MLSLRGVWVSSWVQSELLSTMTVMEEGLRGRA